MKTKTKKMRKKCFAKKLSQCKKGSMARSELKAKKKKWEKITQWNSVHKSIFFLSLSLSSFDILLLLLYWALAVNREATESRESKTKDFL